MHSKTNTWILIISGLIIFLSLIAQLVNFFIYKYPGNNYFPPNILHIAFSLILVYAGLILQVGKNTRLSKRGLELIYFFLVMCLVALATNAVQLTPFPPIDEQIVALENKLDIDMIAILKWTQEHPRLHLLLGFIYDSLTYQMCFIPLFVIAMGRFKIIKEYYFLLLFTTLIGFCFYYFYPTTAPASVISSPFFTPYQIATGLKFNEIHNYLIPSTLEGGLIALPSFHCIWALLCVYLLKEWPIPCLLLFLANIILIASCILLGWHYPIDVITGLILVLMSYWFLQWSKRCSPKPILGKLFK